MQELAVEIQGGTPVQFRLDEIPTWTATDLAQTLCRSVHEAWADPNIRAEYEAWKKEKLKDKR